MLILYLGSVSAILLALFWAATLMICGADVIKVRAAQSAWHGSQLCVRITNFDLLFPAKN